MRVALVTADCARNLDDDLPPLEAAVASRGIEVGLPAWDDPSVEWSAFDLVVVRSTWDWVPRRHEFLSWADEVSRATELANPPSVLAWGTDKRHLRDLVSAGVPVVPTLFFQPGDPVHLPPVDLVVKPAVSAGSQDTARYRPGARAEARDHVERLVAAGRVAMVQPYLDAIDHDGETGVVVIDGEVSHAFRKGPILVGEPELVGGLFAKEDIRGREATAAELEVAAWALAVVPGGRERLLYARVDLVPGPEGGPVVLELEVVEPSLFVAVAPGVADRFAAAVGRRLAASDRR